MKALRKDERSEAGECGKMKEQERKIGRYNTSGLIEAQFEPGSRKRVLRNRLGVKSKREMDRVEAREQLRALHDLIRIYGKSHRFTAADICRIHYVWLGNIYPWAGKYRQVNLSKDDFIFAAANQIPRLMQELEKGALRQFTPCRFDSIEEIGRALAVVHTELILIHPFRDGNGRVARLFATLMALQAGLPSLDFSKLKGAKRREYYAAVRSGLDRDYEAMEDIFSDVIAKTSRKRPT
jgi:cell filamentation protein